MKELSSTLIILIVTMSNFKRHAAIPGRADRETNCSIFAFDIPLKYYIIYGRYSPTVSLAKRSGKFFSSQCLHFAGSGIYSQYCKHKGTITSLGFHNMLYGRHSL
jgi:hypothetical protein